jgi:hypothetical protein
MNLLLLLIGMRPWSVASACDRVTRIFAAITLFSVEMQLVTVVGVGSISMLWGVNAVVAAAAYALWRPAGPPQERVVPVSRAVPALVAAAVLATVVLVNLARPIQAADEYHLQKIAHIQAVGTLAHDPGASVKVNVLGALYELLLADLGMIPGVGAAALRLHGLWGLLLMLTAIAAAREQLPGRDGERQPVDWWPWAAVLLVPALFHQLILIKNDLFVAAPALLVLAWVVGRSAYAGHAEFAWAGWLTGIAVATKLTTLPLAVVLGFAVVMTRRRDVRAYGYAMAGGLAGLAAGGIVLTIAQNLRDYGHLMPVMDQGNVTAGPRDSVINIGRFAISLFDFGLLTRDWWPGRGGWGGTFGLPFIWALVTVVAAARRFPLARRALAAAGVYFLLFATVFPDADVAQRIALAPALLLILVAVWAMERMPGWQSPAAYVPILVLSAAQITRSAYLYFTQL